MDPRNDTWIPLFRHIVVNQRPAERLSRISRFVACSDDGGAIAMQLLEEALRMVREKAPTAEWLSQMVHFKDSNPLIYGKSEKMIARHMFPQIRKLPYPVPAFFAPKTTFFLACLSHASKHYYKIHSTCD